MRRIHAAIAALAFTVVAMPAEGGAWRADGVARNSSGRIARSTAAKSTFRKSHPCPATSKSAGACPGYVIDHVIALKRGGPDHPSNMQWQTREEAKAKDRHE